MYVSFSVCFARQFELHFTLENMKETAKIHAHTHTHTCRQKNYCSNADDGDSTVEIYLKAKGTDKHIVFLTSHCSSFAIASLFFILRTFRFVVVGFFLCVFIKVETRQFEGINGWR